MTDVSDTALQEMSERTPDGKFAPGNVQWTHRKNNRGRPRSLKTQVQSFLEAYPNAYEHVLEILYLNALENGDTKAAGVLADRLRGRASSTVEMRISGRIDHVIATPEQVQAILDARKAQIASDKSKLAPYSPKLVMSGTNHAHNEST